MTFMDLWGILSEILWFHSTPGGHIDHVFHPEIAPWCPPGGEEIYTFTLLRCKLVRALWTDLVVTFKVGQAPSNSHLSSCISMVGQGTVEKSQEIQIVCFILLKKTNCFVQNNALYGGQVLPHVF